MNINPNKIYNIPNKKYITLNNKCGYLSLFAGLKSKNPEIIKKYKLEDYIDLYILLSYGKKSLFKN